MGDTAACGRGTIKTLLKKTGFLAGRLYAAPKQLAVKTVVSHARYTNPP